jgi:Rad3-related DNA helicase
MKLEGMAQALHEQLETGQAKGLAFEERLALLVDREALHRDNRGFARRLQKAKLKQNAALEDLDYKHPRNLDAALVRSLTSCEWVRERHNLIITGPTGVGKTYIACAFIPSYRDDGTNGAPGVSVRVWRVVRADGSVAGRTGGGQGRWAVLAVAGRVRQNGCADPG